MKQDICRIQVNIIDNPYEVVVGSGILTNIGKELLNLNIARGTRVLVVSNSDVAKYYADSIIEDLTKNDFNTKLLIIDAGEDQKNMKSIAQIHQEAYAHQLERNSLIIALGGGVIGDMAGFAAATWLRGISFIQIPTTLLAMVDASIGGKTGVNHPMGKNLIGAFHQPKLVLIDINTLKTLPEREFRCGMAEVIKYGVIGDNILFNKLENAQVINTISNVGIDLLQEIIIRSAKAKTLVVEQDEKESGIRTILNYGHTFGHVIESLCGYGKWLHGEAVSIGMVMVGKLALQKKIWTKQDAERQLALIKKAGLPVKWPKLNYDNILRSLKGDKKVKEGKIRFILPTKIGKVILTDEITEEDILILLDSLNID